MTLLDRILARGVELPADPILVARVDRHLRRIQPDPLFRQRLRGIVVNRHVATREGLAVPPSLPRTRRQMGMLGRGVLYASLLTALSVTGAGAASQTSLPGDALYGVKLGIEELRMHLAPASLRDDLAAMALDERLDEVEALANAGRWTLVPEAASRAAAAEATLEALAAHGVTVARLLTGDNSVERHAARLTELMATAPASALAGLRRALAASTGTPAANDGTVRPHGAHSAQHAGASTGSAGTPSDAQDNGPAASELPEGGGMPGDATGGTTGGNDGDGNEANAGETAAPAVAPATPRPSSASAPPGDQGGGSGDAQGDTAPHSQQ